MLLSKRRIDKLRVPQKPLLYKRNAAKDSVVNISHMITLDKQFLSERAGRLSPRHLRALNEGLRLVLAIENPARE